jgi:hypothetical protein
VTDAVLSVDIVVEVLVFIVQVAPVAIDVLLSLCGASVVTLAKLLVLGLLIAGDIHLSVPNFALVATDIAYLVVIVVVVMPVMVGMVFVVVVGVCRESRNHHRNHSTECRGLNPIFH